MSRKVSAAGVVSTSNEPFTTHGPATDPPASLNSAPCKLSTAASTTMNHSSPQAQPMHTHWPHNPHHWPQEHTIPTTDHSSTQSPPITTGMHTNGQYTSSLFYNPKVEVTFIVCWLLIKFRSENFNVSMGCKFLSNRNWKHSLAAGNIAVS